MSVWTLSIVDDQSLLASATKTLIDADMRYVIEYLDRYIDWKGTLDFRVNIKSYTDLKNELGWDFDGILPATEGGWFWDGDHWNKSNLVEATTGTDRNGADPDAGFTIFLGKDGAMRNYGVPVWLDPGPAINSNANVPAGTHDFISIALHELVHNLAFDGVETAGSPLASKTVLRNGTYYFEGANTVALLGGGLPIDTGNHVISTLSPAYAQSGLMRNFGNYEQNRWDIGLIELAVLKDLGFDVNGSQAGLPYTDIDDKNPGLNGTAAADKLLGDFHDNLLYSLDGNDTLTGGMGNDTLDGGNGTDTAVMVGLRSAYTVTRNGGSYTITAHAAIDSDGTDTLLNVEIIQFANIAISVADAVNVSQSGTAGNDILNAGVANEAFDGGAGLDTVIVNGVRANFNTLKATNGITLADKTAAQGIDTLVDIERIRFSDTSLALDVNGNAGQAYRLYQAAFNRTPDIPGLGWQIKAIDGGMTLKQISENFINSAEFKSLYGDNPSNSELVTLLYNNVLHRAPEQAGYDHWMNILNTNQLSRAEALYYFSESAENQAQVIGAIQNGFEYTYYA